MENTTKNVLTIIQNSIKVAKDKKVGKMYNYRSAEDIYEKIKPLLVEHNAILTISDSIIPVNNHVYIQAKATLRVGDQVFESSAFAREHLDDKTKNPSQVTGSASSYARKYALGGLLLLDDNKDADDEAAEQQKKATQKDLQQINVLLDQLSTIKTTPKEVLANKILTAYQVNSFENMTAQAAQAVISKLKTSIN